MNPPCRFLCICTILNAKMHTNHTLTIICCCQITKRFHFLQANAIRLNTLKPLSTNRYFHVNGPLLYSFSNNRYVKKKKKFKLQNSEKFSFYFPHVPNKYCIMSRIWSVLKHVKWKFSQIKIRNCFSKILHSDKDDKYLNYLG